jgi:alpha-1,2-glucosyltransferase
MHVATIHTPQLSYFLAFSTILALPVLLNEGVTRAIRGAFSVGLGSPSRVAASLVVFSGMIAGVRYHTCVPPDCFSTLACRLMAPPFRLHSIEHPFLLADNRHYFFYVWRKVFKRFPAARYALTPGYLACGWAWLWKIGV